jgi:hypothetical protein
LGAASVEPCFFQKRKEYAKNMLPFLHAVERDGWHHLMTGDESWFFFDISRHRMWTLSRDDVATKSRQQIHSKKIMFTIIWNPTGFDIVDRLPNDTKMNSDYFVTNTFISLEQMIFPCRMAPHEKRLVVSADNCSVHTSRGSIDWLEKYGIHGMPEQYYSPNPAIIYLCLFSTVKEKLERIHLADDDQFFESLQGDLRRLDQQELNTVFQASVRRVQEISEGNGGYVG